MVGERIKEGLQVVITKPLSLDEELSDDENEYKAPNMLRRALNLFTNLRSGSDLTRLQITLPPIFNIPKSQLQCYGESVYCVGNDDMLRKCNTAESPIERLAAVVAWSVSTLRPLSFGLAPYNPILGETHHVSRGTLNVLLEQVSHHPPVSALHATDEKENIELIWCQQPVPKFYGTSVEAEVQGARRLRLLNFGETYTMNTPRLSIKFFPVPGVEWVGTDKIQCNETGLEAKLVYGRRSFLGFGGGSRSITGHIFCSTSTKPTFEINGHWDRTVTLKDLKTGHVRVIYNAKETITGLKTPLVQNSKGILRSESALVWGEVSEAIIRKDWERAREAKKQVEDKQREDLKERQSVWVPNHFIMSYHKDVGWECSPIAKFVHVAPINVPLIN